MFNAIVINEFCSSNRGTKPWLHSQKLGTRRGDTPETLRPYRSTMHSSQGQANQFLKKKPPSGRQSSNYTHTKRYTMISYISKSYFRLKIRKKRRPCNSNILRNWKASK